MPDDSQHDDQGTKCNDGTAPINEKQEFEKVAFPFQHFNAQSRKRGAELLTELPAYCITVHLNAVDYTYQTQLRDTNELNWERFKAELLGQGASIRGELRAESASIRSELHSELASVRSELHSELASVRSELQSGLASVRAEIKSERAALSEELHRAMGTMQKELQRWMFIYWCGSIATLGGLLVGLVTLAR